MAQHVITINLSTPQENIVAHTAGVGVTVDDFLLTFLTAKVDEIVQQMRMRVDAAIRDNDVKANAVSRIIMNLSVNYTPQP